ncbi:MAG: hypothetical protein JWN34_3769 [Bryobacterales bacterium]|nr:hypothetical protein [Bryobacterales bacterium]
MTTLLTRTPKGQFLWKGQALEFWLPVLLDACSGDAVTKALTVLGTFMRREQATWLRNAALNLENGNDYSWCLVAAEKYAQKREILLKAKADIAAVDGVPF